MRIVATTKKYGGGYSEKGWTPFSGDILEKINSILPKGISKYFLLDGEKSRDIVLDSNELKKAVYALFNLNIYEKAIEHLGAKSTKNSVLGHFATELSKNPAANLDGQDLLLLDSEIKELDEKITNYKNRKSQNQKELAAAQKERDDVLKKMGAGAAENLDSLIEQYKKNSSLNDEKISENRFKLGDLFYKNYPYLFLKNLSQKSQTIIEQKKQELFENKIIFEHLKKELLCEILEKNVCVCERPLQEAERKKIQDIIDIMPPGNFEYTFNQFLASQKKRIAIADEMFVEVEKISSEIEDLENENDDLQKKIEDCEQKLKQMNTSKELKERLQNLDEKIKKTERERDALLTQIEKEEIRCREKKKRHEDALEKQSKNDKSKRALDFFENVLSILKNEKEEKKLLAQKNLDLCIKEVFKKLTTQKNFDTEKIQFIDENFSLRETYLSGGQKSVDVYSYVIGIVKALKQQQMQDKEMPIIVDAPFAFNDGEQSEHIFLTLPEVASQTILLTMNLENLKNPLQKKELFDYYEIKNETQKMAKIQKGEL